MFGGPICDGENQCENREVLQYNEALDTWDSLGYMQETRLLHEVIEVPGSFCDDYVTAEPGTTVDPGDKRLLGIAKN